MTIRRFDLSECKELNLKVYTLCKHISWGYGRIVQEVGFSKSQVRDIVKKNNEHGGDVWNAPRSKHRTKITKAKRKRILEIMDKNTRFTL